MALFSLVRHEIGLLALCLALRSWPFSVWCKLFAASFFITAATLITIVFVLFIRALTKPRILSYHPDSREDLLGRPLLFATSLGHVRVSPVKTRFKNRALYVGMPVGLRGRIGSVISLDEPLPANYAASLSVYPTRDRAVSWMRAWFTFDPVPHLHRGDYQRDLREKLDVFLGEQHECPANWPYAYILSTPRFLGYSRNVVSWWYLYTPSRELGAVIMEIYNSFGEKRSTFIPLARSCESHETPAITNPGTNDAPDSIKRSTTIQGARHLSSKPTAKFYKGSFRKEIFASPFEKVGELIYVRFTDPLQESSWLSGSSLSITTTVGSAGEARMVSRLHCVEPPLDPTQATWKELAFFLWHWTIPNLITGFTIVYAAIKIRSRGLMKMMSKSAPRAGTIPQHPSSTEMKLEYFFCKYLASCVAEYPDNLEVIYIPSKSISNDTIRMFSASCQSERMSVKRLTVQPLDPGFYTRITNYSDARIGFAMELEPTRDEADQTTSALSASDASLLAEILACRENTIPVTERIAETSWAPIQNFVNKNRGVGFMDRFVLDSESQTMQNAYFSLVARDWVAKRFFFGYLDLLNMCQLLAVIGGRVFSLMVAGYLSSTICQGVSEAALLGVVYFAMGGVTSMAVSV